MRLSFRKVMAPIGALVLVFAATTVPAQAGPLADGVPVEHPASYVDPFIGTAGGGTTWPGSVLPFGMIAWSPTSTTGDQTNTGAAGGYSYNTTRVRGFSLTHVNGTGCHPGAAGDVPIMPFTGEITTSPTADTRDLIYASDFSHDQEKATPGRYTVTLASGVTTDLAVTRRAGVAEFAFPSDKPAKLLFRTSNSLNGSEDAEIHIDAAQRRVTGSVLTGSFCGRRANGGENNRKSYYRLYFAADFDKPITETGTWHDATVTPGGTDATGGEGYATGAARAGRGSGGWIGFDTSTGPTVRMRVGISYVGVAGAQANLDAELRRSSTVEKVATAGFHAWDKALKAVRISGGSEAQRSVFYTALYHSLLQPNLMSDVDGSYLGMDRKVHQVRTGQNAQYSNFSGWDQYHAQIQLLALLEPGVAGDFAQSLYNYAGQNGGVWDRWVHVNGATHVMTGDPSAITLATFYAMGVRNFDAVGAFDSLIRQATVPHPDGLSDAGCPGQCVGARPNLAQYLGSHYSAQDVCHCWGGAAETLEQSIADSSLASWAELLGREDLQREFAARASYWRNTFNPAATPGGGYAQARRLDGGWVTPFSPATGTGFAQGTSATYTWLVPQDVSGLAEAMGGRERAAARLDDFFHKPDGSWSLRGGDPLRYDSTNEPGLHAPWLYNALGQPWKTQQTVRQILDTVYTTGPSGLPGNDDLGTMSAWYVLGALGLFPQTPGRAEMLLSAPLFPSAIVHRQGSRRPLIIAAPEASTSHRYIAGAGVNAQPYDRSWVDGSLIRDGGVISFKLTSAPDLRWGTSPQSLPVDHGKPDGGQ
ncbi:GH92 family glycosyl hydrolase [Nonomuraea pusilla]|uniref:Alpha-1,2-mannosidase, putative n=1 Tax=Nonomuraea pusilla TaxID=46177 RepID=A0A1H7JL80_9ACTN|nr:GH92 family glycosyl hydrolase [Nonomuraea pusilla]SEK75398.1 alpha-1,2-mannosidase, putative [Nonomuraea pusilla]